MHPPRFWLPVRLAVFFLLAINFLQIKGDKERVVEDSVNSNVGEESSPLQSKWSHSTLVPKRGPSRSKRLETIDGVEIASSYKEYLDLALDDLEDRLRRSGFKLSDFQERIGKREKLLNEIEKEIKKRREFSTRLSEKDKILRNRLLRNTEMKSALQNLADIAGYKLNSAEKERFYSDLSVRNINAEKKDGEINGGSSNLPYVLANKLDKKSSQRLRQSLNNRTNSGSYTRYIEMAYAEVESILAKDKSSLIIVIRNLKTNDMKLKELVKLKVKVNSSLGRLSEFRANLVNIIDHDRQIETTVKQLESQIKSNSNTNFNNNNNENNNNNSNNNNRKRNVRVVRVKKSENELNERNR